jgi:hypothetical protein
MVSFLMTLYRGNAINRPNKSLCKGREKPLTSAIFCNIAGISLELEDKGKIVPIGRPTKPSVSMLTAIWSFQHKVLKNPIDRGLSVVAVFMKNSA